MAQPHMAMAIAGAGSGLAELRPPRSLAAPPAALRSGRLGSDRRRLLHRHAQRPATRITHGRRDGDSGYRTDSLHAQADAFHLPRLAGRGRARRTGDCRRLLIGPVHGRSPLARRSPDDPRLAGRGVGLLHGAGTAHAAPPAGGLLVLHRRPDAGVDAACADLAQRADRSAGIDTALHGRPRGTDSALAGRATPRRHVRIRPHCLAPSHGDEPLAAAALLAPAGHHQLLDAGAAGDMGRRSTAVRERPAGLEPDAGHGDGHPAAGAGAGTQPQWPDDTQGGLALIAPGSA